MTREKDFGAGPSGSKPAAGRRPPSRSQEPPAIQIKMPNSGSARLVGGQPRPQPGSLDNVEGLLHSLISRLDDNDQRYGAALEDMNHRLSELGERARGAGGSGSKHSVAALGRVREQASSLAEQINIAEQRHKAHRGAPRPNLDERISAVADRIDRTDTYFDDRRYGSNPGPAVNDDFAEVTQRLEKSLSARTPASEFDFLANRMDDLAGRFDAALNSQDNVHALESIESQLNNLTDSFSDARQQHERIESIERHLHNLMDWANSANAPAGESPDDRLDAIEMAIKELNNNAREMDSRTVSTLETMNSTLQSLAQRIEAKRIDEPANAAPPLKHAHRDAPQDDYPEVWVDDANEAEYSAEPLARRHSAPDPNQMGATIPDYQPTPGHPEETVPHTQNEPSQGKSSAPAEPDRDLENDFIASARRAAAAASAQDAPASPLRAGQRFLPGNNASSPLSDPKRQRPLLVMAAVGLLLVSAGLLYSRLKTTSETASGIGPAQIAPPPPSSSPMSPSSGTSSDTGSPSSKPSDAKSPGDEKQHSTRMQYQSEPARPSAPARPDSATTAATPPVTRASLRTPSAAIAASATQVLTEPNFNQPLSTATVLASLPRETGAEQMSGVSFSIKEAAVRTAPRATAPALVPSGYGKSTAAPMAQPKRVPAPAKAARRTPPAGSIDSAPAHETRTPANNIATAMPPATIGPQSLRMAAARGNPAAQVEVASRYAKGSGVAKNLKKAALWFGRAASQGYAPAQYRLAALHERGQGVKQDIAMARTWYRRAAELGNVRAMHNLAVLYTRPDGKGPDYVTAKNWFFQGARYGLADSQFNLGILYESGLGAQLNVAEAYKWFTLAARQGDKGALKRRELIRTRLSAKALASVEQTLKSWNAVPVKQAANRTGPPKGGWQNARTENTSAGSDPALIARAQFLLNKLGYDAGTPDGRMGPKTAAAIRKFEGRSGKTKTGQVTPVLLRRLAVLGN